MQIDYSYIFPLFFILFGICFLILAKSKKNHTKLVENNGVEYAEKTNKILKICACSLLLIGGGWLLIGGVWILFFR